MSVSLGKWEWYQAGGTWVTGFIFEGQELLEGEKLHEYFSGIGTTDDFRKKLRDANGQFSVIIKKDSAYWLATDRLRNFPLFYSADAQGYSVSDECYYFAGKDWQHGMNQAAERSIMSAGYVINNLTLLTDVFQVEAGGYVILGDEITRNYYDAGEPGLTAGDAGAAGLERALHDVFKKHFTALKDRFIAIPLSGGFDSRLIAAMCTEYHPANVLCFTYGSKEQPEARLAGESASRLGLPWTGITYDKDLVNDFVHDNTFLRYYPYAAELSSMFYMQDYFAVKFLKDKNLVPPDTIFIPGHSGDMLAGSHLEPGQQKISSFGRMADLILKRFFDLHKPDAAWKKEITGLISDNLARMETDPLTAFELWDRKERQAKFIVNSAKAFTFFGYDYDLPLWDNELIDFFSGVPFRMKLDKKLYDQVLKEKIFSRHDINFPGELAAGPWQKRIQRAKDNIKPLVPRSITRRLIDLRSPVAYDLVTEILKKDAGPGAFRPPRQDNLYNSYIVQWYLWRTVELLGKS